MNHDDDVTRYGGHPATAERIYDREETALLRAIDGFRTAHRRLPSVTEMFRLFKGIDHQVKVEAAEQLRPPVNAIPPSLAATPPPEPNLSHVFKPNMRSYFKSVA